MRRARHVRLVQISEIGRYNLTGFIYQPLPERNLLYKVSNIFHV
jgi:hypothetical protein